MTSGEFTPRQERRLLEIVTARLKSLRHEASDHLERALNVSKLKPSESVDAVLVTTEDGAAWRSLGTEVPVDHGTLAGLSDDDHTQYHNDSRGDVRYYTKSQVDTAIAGRASDAELASEASTRASADAALDSRLDAIEAVDYATDAELDAHKSSSDHDGRYYTETEVDALIAGRASDAELAALQAEVDADEAALSAHISDTTDAHDATAISVDSTNLAGTATNVQGVLEEFDDIFAGGTLATSADLTAHISDATDAHDASAISLLDTEGNYDAVNVEDAFEEVVDLIAAVAVEPRGEYDAGTFYDERDVVSYDGGSYIRSDFELGQNGHLPTSSGHWTQLAAQGDTGPTGASGVDAGGLAYAFDSNTNTAVAPGNGELKVNHATISSASVMAIHEDSAAAGYMRDFILAWDNSTSSVKGFVFIQKANDPSYFVVYGVTGSITEQTGFLQVPVSAFAAGNAFADGDGLAVSFVATGNTGSTGATGAAGADGTAAVNAHIADTSAAHAASSISADSTTLVGTGTDVQAVLEELDNGIADHLADTTAAHAASAISADSTTLVGTGTTVQAVFEELDNAIVATETVANGAIQKSLVDAKGDMLVGTASDTVARVAVGANGSTWVASSGATPGGEWLGSRWQVVASGMARAASGSRTTDFFLLNGGIAAVSTTGVSAAAFYFDPANLPDGGLDVKVKLRAWVITEVDPTDSAVTVALNRITSFGALGTIAGRDADVVSGSTSALAVASANSDYTIATSSANISTAGLYVVKFIHDISPGQPITYGYQVLATVG